MAKYPFFSDLAAKIPKFERTYPVPFTEASLKEFIWD